MNKWYSMRCDNNDVVISTRIRLARNIDDYPFPSRLNKTDRNKVNETVKGILFENDNFNLSYIEMQNLNRLQAISLAERHLISPEFASCFEGTALILSEDESVSVMLNEEDHIKIQVMKSGFDLDNAYKIADEIDSLIDSKVKYAFDERIGYLTSLPTNLGTAMRASVFLHLPALSSAGRISGIANTVSKLGLSITGVYGKRNKPSGDIYQVSNQLTLGITEETAIANLKSIVLQLVAQEKAAAEKLIKDPVEEDRIFRSFAVLQNARLLNSSEFMDLISSVRMGVATGLLSIPAEVINELIIEMQPATISVSQDNIDSITARDIARASHVREKLKEYGAA